jgi:Kef-type K+ transport system membrane component KefB
VRPFLARIGNLHQTKESLSKPIVAIFFLTLIISSYATEVIGIHALFGAFMAGAIMPENIKFRNIFIEKVEDVALVLLLPLFFVFTGLRTEIGLLNDPYLWKVTGLIILVAVVGKFIGSAIAAKFVGQNWKDSLTIGALMNTRGLMELVVLNIGYDLGVLTPEIFAMMVIMALVTTFMTGPALDLINWTFKSKQLGIPEEISQINKFKVLVSFGNPDRGKSLLRLANSLIRKLNGNAVVTAMHLSQTKKSASIGSVPIKLVPSPALSGWHCPGHCAGYPAWLGIKYLVSWWLWRPCSVLAPEASCLRIKPFFYQHGDFFRHPHFCVGNKSFFFNLSVLLRII